MPSLKKYKHDHFSQELGLADHRDSNVEKRTPLPWGIARLIRREVRRRGLVTRRELRKAIEPFLVSSGFDVDAYKTIQEVAARMVEVRELSDLKVENQRGYSAMPSRWILISDVDAVLLGTTATKMHRFSSFHPSQFLRRFRPSHSIVSDFVRIGISEQSFEDWLGETNWTLLATSSQRIDTLSELLAFYVNKLEQDGSPFRINQTTVLVVNRCPGEFFGSERNPAGSRWTHPRGLGDGIYVGAQPGQHERHWIPLLIKIEKGEGRSLALNCRNQTDLTFELRNWLLVAIGATARQPEVIDADYGASEIQCAFPAPSLIRSILTLVGERIGKWQRYAVRDVKATSELLARAVPEVQIRNRS